LDGICDPWITPTLPVCEGADGCPNVPEDYDAFQDADGCVDPDNDNDGFPDYTDDCPGTDWTAGPDGIPCNQDDNTNTCEDYDDILDTDGCHDSPGDDYDQDSSGLAGTRGLPFFSDEVEVFLDTDPTEACPTTAVANDEAVDAWPPDFNDNGQTDIGDLVLLKNHWVPLGNPYGARYDLNASGMGDIGDLVILKLYWIGGGYDTCSVG
jgi:hypothetical protein